jgi:hypothetical protein
VLGHFGLEDSPLANSAIHARGATITVVKSSRSLSTDGRDKATAAAVSSPQKGPTMLSATLGMLALLPVGFGVAGSATVSR